MGIKALLARLFRDSSEGGVVAVGTVDRRPTTAEPPALNLDENQLVIDAIDADPDLGQGLMIDVGVHFGSTTTPFLDRGWRVIGFEPDKKKHAALKQLASENSRFTLHTCAVGDKAAEGVQFYTSQESTGIASLVPFRETHEKGDLVPVRTLREVLSESGEGDVEYLKVDAEGFDLRVLEGFPFETIRPRYVMCEFEETKTRNIGYSTDDLGGFLLDLGYNVYMSEWHPIVRYGITHRWRSIRPYPCELADPRGWGNFVASLPGPADDRLRAAMERWV